MKRLALTALAPVLGLTAACSEAEPVEPSDAAADFAARINGGSAAPAGPQPTGQQLPSPQMVPPRDPAAPPPVGVVPGAGPQPVTVTCNADLMGPFLGREADDETRMAVMSAAQGASDVRFVPAGSGFIESDPANPRLNVMLDSSGVIRDAKCG